jgi:hypothetical protein
MSPRSRILHSILERAHATGRRVFVLVGKGAVPCSKGVVPADAKKVCVEGDSEWVALPAEERK